MIGGRQRPVGVAVDGVVELLGEAAGLHEVGALDGPDLVRQELAQHAHLQVGLLLVGDAIEELVGQDRQLRCLDAGECVDVDDGVGGDGLVDQLADGGFQFDACPAAGATGVGVLDLEDGGADVREQTHVVADGERLVPAGAERKGPGQGKDLVQVAGLAVAVAHDDIEDRRMLRDAQRRGQLRVGVVRSGCQRKWWPQCSRSTTSSAACFTAVRVVEPLLLYQGRCLVPRIAGEHPY